jgi:hypothetical protein
VHQCAPWLAWLRAASHAGAGSDDISRRKPEGSIRGQFVAGLPTADSTRRAINDKAACFAVPTEATSATLRCQ